MRIIKNPNPYPEEITTCNICQCEFAYNKSDIRSKSNGIMGPGHSNIIWVSCPNCGTNMTIYRKGDYKL